MNIHKLSPDTLVLARDRVLDFIRLAREEITALIPSEQWDEDIWLVAGEFDEKSHNYGERILAFYNSDATISSQQVVTGEPLHPLIKDFAKAYVRYLHSTSPVAHSGTRRRMGPSSSSKPPSESLALNPLSSASTSSY